MGGKILEYTLRGLIEDSFKNRGEHTLFTAGGRGVTYQEGNAFANGLGKELERMHVKAGDRVACISDLPRIHILSLLTCIKFGFSYMPVDPKFPRRRIKAMLDAAQVSAGVCDGKWLPLCREIMPKIPVVTGDGTFTDKEAGDYWADTDSSSEAYVYFTSGTAGQPKGIAGQEKGLAHFIKWEISEFGFGEDLRAAQFTPPCHDPFLRDVLVPMSVGGTICIPAGRKQILCPEEAVRWMEEEGVSLLHCTPGMFSIISAAKLDARRLPSLKHIFLAGELLHSSLIKDWMELFGGRMELINLYGPTETTLAKLYHRITPADLEYDVIPVGTCIPGARAVIVDQNGKICSNSRYGEVWIRTPYRSLGYLDEAQNEGRFILNPFSQKEGDIVYKTGDRGRVLSTGEIEVVGRTDRQIKIRGHRIELSEVESALDASALVRRSAVVFVEEEELLYGFVQPVSGQAEADVHKIMAEAAQRLPEYMVPGVIEILTDGLPVNDNAKTDYRELSERARGKGRETVAPETPEEKMLCELCCELLHKNSVSMTDNLFRLGISSVNIMRFVNRINEKTGCCIGAADIFSNRTMELRELAAMIETDQENGAADREIPPAPKADDYPAALAQRRIFLRQQMDAESVLYNITRVFRTGKITEEQIEGAFKQLTEEHEIFRTSFFSAEGEVRQKIADEVPFTLERIKCEGTGVEQAVKEFRRPFDLAQAPLLRAGVVTMGDGTRILVTDVHHIIIDGRSLDLAMSEIYENIMFPGRHQEKISYRDFAVWQKKQIADGAMEADREYWNRRLGGPSSPVEIFAARQRPAVFSHRGRKRKDVIDEKLRAMIKEKAGLCNTTEFVVLLAVFYLLLYKNSGSRNITVGTVANGRNSLQEQDMLGMFVNTVALRNTVDPEESISDFTGRLHDSVYRDLRHQTLSFELVVEMLQIPREAGRNPLFDFMFVYQEQRRTRQTGEFELLSFDQGVSAYDMTFELVPDEKETEIVLEYCTDLYDDENAEYMLKHYLYMLYDFCSRNITDTVGAVTCVSQEERLCILDYSQCEGKEELPFASVCSWFKNTALKKRNQTAVIRGENSVTYGQLDLMSDRVAAALVSENVKTGSYVGVIASHTIEMVAAALAVLKLGAAYVPVDACLPMERIRYILNDCGAVIALSDDSVPVQMEGVGVISVRSISENPQGETVDLPEVTGSCPAYVIYTSGSTGYPKGVEITNENLMTYIRAFMDYVVKRENFTMLQMASISFDVSVEEIFGTILSGGRLVMVSKEEMFDLDRITAIIKCQDVNYMSTSPQYAKVLGEAITSDTPECIVIGGDVFTVHCAKKLAEHARVLNSYGPTETTIAATYHEYDPSVSYERVPVGRPLYGYNVYVMDEAGRLCGFDIPGEICISGPGVSRGYLNLSEENARVFCRDPFTGGRMYRSGDCGVLRPDGNIYFISRLDKQVKIRGYRIEPEEIERCAVSSGMVSDFAAGVYTSPSGQSVLFGAYISDREAGRDLLDYLAERLPAYMIPETVIRVDHFPENVNGKLDRDKLALLCSSKTMEQTADLPETEEEKKLAALWQNILHCRTVSLRDNFWSLGGNSILAIQMVREAQEQGFRVTINDVFESLTLSKMLEKSEARKKDDADSGYVNERLKNIMDGKVQVVPGDSGFVIQADLEYDGDTEEQILEVLRGCGEVRGGISQIVWRNQTGPAAGSLEFPSMPVQKKAPGAQRQELLPAQYYYIRMDEQYCFDEIPIEGCYSRRQICRAMHQVMEEQPALSSGYTARGHIFRCMALEEQDIPYRDLSGLGSQQKNTQLALYREELCSVRPSGNTPFRMLIVRTEAGSHRVLLYIHHAFYDLYSGKALSLAMVQALEGRMAAPGRQQTELLPFDPQQIHVDEFCELSAQLAKTAGKMEKGSLRVTCTCPLQGPLNEMEVIDQAASHIASVFGRLYHMEKLPVWMLYHGRGEESSVGFSAIGAFMDVVPMVADTACTQGFAKAFEESRKLLARSGISIGGVLMGKETRLKGEKWVKFLRRLALRQFIVINYQGTGPEENHEAKVGTELNMNRNMAVVRRDGEHIAITYSLPVHPDRIDCSIFGKDYRVEI